MILWNYLAKHAYKSQIQKALRSERIAEYAYQKLKQLEAKLGKNLWVEQTPLSLTVRFKKANSKVISEYSLSEQEFYVDGQKRAYNHIFAMEHVTTETIDRLIKSLGKSGAFPKQEAETSSLPTEP